MLLHKFIKLSLRTGRVTPGATKLLYSILNPFWNGKIRLPSKERAIGILHNFCPDNGASAVTAPPPLPAPEYDLAFIVGAYNVGQYIGECLDSILTQATDYRIIVNVVDDGSSDSTPDVLRKYAADPRVRIFHHDGNRGLAAARNTALQRLDATYIACLDADDKLYPDTIDKVLDMAFRTDADAVEVGIDRFSDDGTILYTLRPEENSDTHIRDIISQPTFFIYRRDLYRGVVFPLNLWYEDVIYELLFYPRLKRVVSSAHPYYMYRMRPGSITQSSDDPRQLHSLYGGISVLRDSMKLDLWNKPENIRWLTDCLYHPTRNTNTTASHRDSKGGGKLNYG